jgi:hypothetical protein
MNPKPPSAPLTQRRFLDTTPAPERSMQSLNSDNSLLPAEIYNPNNTQIPKNSVIGTEPEHSLLPATVYIPNSNNLRKFPLPLPLPSPPLSLTSLDDSLEDNIADLRERGETNEEQGEFELIPVLP